MISARCRGAAGDMFLGKNPLSQEQPLTVERVRHLESLMHTAGTVLQCILGQLLFCIHSCCRWKDAQRLKPITLESGPGKSLVRADALASKTALTMEAKTRYSEKHSSWASIPMGAAEATVWLREFLDSAETPFQPQLTGSHTCKTTLLTGSGRCTKLVFTPTERRLLEHRLDANMKSVMCYSRECCTSLHSKALNMTRLIRAGDFRPDQPTIDRVVQLAEGIEECAAGAQQVDEDEAAGIPETALLVHRVSGLVHIMGEDDSLSCGRPTSRNFRSYANVPDRGHLDACRHCLRSFRNRED